MSKIGTPPPSRPLGDAGKAEGPAKPAQSPTTAPAQTPPQAETPDRFERSASQGAQILEQRLQGLAGKITAGKLQFTAKDLEEIARTFAAELQQIPGADRARRAREFAKAVLRRKKLKMSEPEMNQMCDIIGDVLDSAPVFGQLVDNVTEGAGKLNAG